MQTKQVCLLGTELLREHDSRTKLMLCKGVRTEHINNWGIMYMSDGDDHKKSEFKMVLVQRIESVGFSNDLKQSLKYSLGNTGKEN